jgi:hypothetical protein
MEREDNMHITGEYVFYQDGKEICRNSNLLTKFGKRFLTSYLAGAVSFNNINTPTLSLAFPTVSTATNYQLEVIFEFWQMVSISDLGIVSISASY